MWVFIILKIVTDYNCITILKSKKIIPEFKQLLLLRKEIVYTKLNYSYY